MSMGRYAICPYCGLSCRMRLSPTGGMSPDPTDPVSGGSPCIRGLTAADAPSAGRIREPLVRGERGRPFRPIEWREAISRVAAEVADADPRGIAMAISGRITNEDAFSLVKLALSAMHTANVDSASGRVCHAATVDALRSIYGLPASIGRLSDMGSLDLLLLAGTNPAADYPPMFARISRARKGGMKLAVVGSLNTVTARAADANVLVRPGGEVAVFNYIAREVVEAGAYPKSAEGLEGFPEYVRALASYDLGRASDALLGPAAELRRAAEMVVEASMMGVASGVGLTQRAGSCDALTSFYSLALLKGAVTLTMRGLVNVQGVGDMGACPGLGCWGEGARSKAEEAWGPLPSWRGMTISEALYGHPRLVFMTDMNPLHSMPDPGRLERSLADAFVVCMCSYCNETAARVADVVLPSPTILEREGTVTNGERRVRPLIPVNPPYAGSRQEWALAAALAAALGRDGFNYRSAWDVTAEIASMAPGYGGISVEALRAGYDQWAVKEGGRPRFPPPPASDPSPMDPPLELPWLLVSVRSPIHFLGGEVTWRVRRLARASDPPVVLMNPDDHAELGLGGLGVRARVKACGANSRCVEGLARADPSIPRGFLGYYLSNRGSGHRYNELVELDLEPCSGTPRYRYVPVKLMLSGGEGGEELRPPARLAASV